MCVTGPENTTMTLTWPHFAASFASHVQPPAALVFLWHWEADERTITRSPGLKARLSGPPTKFGVMGVVGFFKPCDKHGVREHGEVDLQLALRAILQYRMPVPVARRGVGM